MLQQQRPSSAALLQLKWHCFLLYLLLQAPGTSVNVQGDSPTPPPSSPPAGDAASPASPAPCTPVYVTAPYTNVKVQVGGDSSWAAVCSIQMQRHLKSVKRDAFLHGIKHLFSTTGPLSPGAVPNAANYVLGCTQAMVHAAVH